MRVLYYNHSITLEPWITVSLVDLKTLKETDFPNKQHFDKVIEAVKNLGFSYTVVERADDVFIESNVRKV